MKKPHIFVSYSREDAEFKDRLVEDLREAGSEVCVDVGGISHGNFMRRIDEALAQCDWMVLVLTPHAIASDYVTEETYTALHRVKQGFMHAVIPILASPCAAGTIPPQWDALQCYDATRNYAGALASVLRAVGLTPTPSANTLAPTAKKSTAATSAPSSKGSTPSRRTPSTRTYRCSFCGKSHDQVKRLIAGPGAVYICNECIEICTDILVEEGDWVTTPAVPKE